MPLYRTGTLGVLIAVALSALVLADELSRADITRLESALNSDQKRTRALAMKEIKRLGDRAKPLVRSLAQYAGRTNYPEDRPALIDLLGGMKGSAADSAPALVQLLDKQYPIVVRQRAAKALGQIGRADCVFALEAQEKDPALKNAVAAALKSIGELSEVERDYYRDKWRWVYADDKFIKRLNSTMLMKGDDLDSLSIGGVGLARVKVIQMLDESSAIVSHGDTWMRLREIPEGAGLADGDRFEGHLVVVGTYAYTTVTGAKRTIMDAVLSPRPYQGLSREEWKSTRR